MLTMHLRVCAVRMDRNGAQLNGDGISGTRRKMRAVRGQQRVTAPSVVHKGIICRYRLGFVVVD